MLTHPDELVALARRRQEEALRQAAQRRLTKLARTRMAGPREGVTGTGLVAGLVAPLSGLRRHFRRLGPLVRRVVLVPALAAAATVVSGLLTAA
jgi:hypothetical protein